MLVTVMDMKEEVGVIDVYVVSLLNRKAKKKKKSLSTSPYSQWVEVYSYLALK